MTRIKVKVAHVLSETTYAAANSADTVRETKYITSRAPTLVTLPEHGKDTMLLRCPQCEAAVKIEVRSHRARLPILLASLCLGLALLSPMVIGAITNTGQLEGVGIYTGLAGLIVLWIGGYLVNRGVVAVKPPKGHFLKTADVSQPL